MAEIYCLLASLCWSISPLLITNLLRKVGAYPVAAIRFLAGSFLLWAAVFSFNISFATVSSKMLLALMGSGVIGIAAGDLFLTNSMKILGPTKSYFVYLTNIPLSILFSWILFDEILTFSNIIGCVSIIVAMSIINIFRHKELASVSLENVHGSFYKGVVFGLIASVCQSLGVMLVKFGTQGEISPILATAIRLSTACCLISIPFFLFHRQKLRQFNAFDLKKAMLAMFIGNLLGMSFFTMGISGSKGGIAAFLTSMAPIMTIPLIAIKEKKWPNRYKVLAGLFAVLGIYLAY